MRIDAHLLRKQFVQENSMKMTQNHGSFDGQN